MATCSHVPTSCLFETRSGVPEFPVIRPVARPSIEVTFYTPVFSTVYKPRKQKPANQCVEPRDPVDPHPRDATRVLRSPLAPSDSVHQPLEWWWYPLAWARDRSVQRRLDSRGISTKPETNTIMSQYSPNRKLDIPTFATPARGFVGGNHDRCTIEPEYAGHM